MENKKPQDQEKLKALDQVLAQIEKHYGKGAIMKLGDAAANVDIDVIPTGCLSLDIALGIGGLPRGRIVEIYGPESSGKTTVALHAIAQAQRAGGIAAFVDAEHALDPVYAKKLGVNLEDLYVSQPDTGEQALDIVDALVRSGAVDLIVVDSVAALTPKAEIEGDMGDSHVGLQARLMSQALRKLTGFINKSKTCVIFINQLREKVGVMFGNPETTPGGKALKFYASIRIDVRKGEALKDSEGIMGNKTKAKIVKNKLAPPSRRRSSTSSTARASRRRGASSISASPATSSTRAAHGSRMKGKRSRRAASACANGCAPIPTSRARSKPRSARPTALRATRRRPQSRRSKRP